jgi:hypothetical protein
VPRFPLGGDALAFERDRNALDLHRMTIIEICQWLESTAVARLIHESAYGFPIVDMDRAQRRGNANRAAHGAREMRVFDEIHPQREAVDGYDARVKTAAKPPPGVRMLVVCP